MSEDAIISHKNVKNQLEYSEDLPQYVIAVSPIKLNHRLISPKFARGDVFFMTIGPLMSNRKRWIPRRSQSAV